MISYEEYYPYGDTSYRSSKSGTEVSEKRYRYTGKEKDEESGLYYHGARYYAAWLGRWTAADPAGMVDGACLYAYVRNHPTGLVDPDGKQSIAINPSDFSSGLRFAPLVAPFVVPLIANALPAILVLSILTLGGSTDPRVEEHRAATASPAAAIPIQKTTVAQPPSSTTSSGTITRPRPVSSSGHRTKPTRMTGPKPAPKKEPATDPDPKPVIPFPAPQDKSSKNSDPGRIYATYTKLNTITGKVYSGRTSMEIDLSKSHEEQAQLAVDNRDLHRQKDDGINTEPRGPGWQQAVLDKFDVGNAVNYQNRKQDLAYSAIRGREQQLIDYNGAEYLLTHSASSEQLVNFQGGAMSDTQPAVTGNIVRGVAKNNPEGRIYDFVTTLRFGRIFEYTGN